MFARRDLPTTMLADKLGGDALFYMQHFGESFEGLESVEGAVSEAKEDDFAHVVGYCCDLFLLL